jgi:hypothetical protein
MSCLLLQEEMSPSFYLIIILELLVTPSEESPIYDQNPPIIKLDEQQHNFGNCLTDSRYVVNHSIGIALNDIDVDLGETVRGLTELGSSNAEEATLAGQP